MNSFPLPPAKTRPALRPLSSGATRPKRRPAARVERGDSVGHFLAALGAVLTRHSARHGWPHGS